MGRTLYTTEGLHKLAEIVRQVRSDMSYRDFAAKAGISHATIRRIEAEEVKEPEISTLTKLAPFTPYTIEELIRICQQSSGKLPDVRTYRLAEDILPMVDDLPDIEAAKVAQAIIARLVKPSVSLNGKGEGVMLQVELMSQAQLAQLLRAIADKLEL